MNILKQLKPKILIIALIAGIVAFGGSYALASMRSQTGQVSEVAIEVNLNENSADPDSIAVVAGQTVIFNSADGKVHNLSLGEGGDEHDHYGPFSSGDFGEGEAWRVTFEEPGTYFFHDHTNPSINVLVVVYNQDSEQALIN